MYNANVYSLQSQQRQQQQRPVQNQPVQQQQLLAPIKASVPRYCFDNDMYWYIIEAQMSDGRWWELSRYYADFYDFQIALLEKFPTEAGNRGSPRTLPFMPGPVAHVTDAISNGRRQNLDDYIKKIVDQPDHIREDILVRKLFAPKPGQDYEIDPEAVEDDYRLSGLSLAQTQSRQSSGAVSARTQGSVGGGYGAPPMPNQARGMNGHPVHQTRPSQGQSYHPPLHSQASNLTTNSTSTHNSAREKTETPSTSVTGLPPGSTLKPDLKIKLEHDKDIIIIRVPQDVDFDNLVTRVRSRLRVVDGVKMAMRYRDDAAGTTVTLNDNEDLARAKEQRNMRIVIDLS